MIGRAAVQGIVTADATIPPGVGEDTGLSGAERKGAQAPCWVHVLAKPSVRNASLSRLLVTQLLMSPPI